MPAETLRVIPANHPALAGHFPGNPIVPGVVLLDAVIAALADRHPDQAVIGVPVVKFLAPLRPEQPFLIRWVATRPHHIRFECVQPDGLLLAWGQIALRPE